MRRFPKLPGRGADEAAAVEAQPAPPQHTGVTAVPIPESVPPPLTSELTRSIRFSISEPQGYYFEQVETFVQQVIEVLAFYEQAEYKWQQFAYDMQVEVDQQAHDAQRLRSEIELFKVQGSPLVNADGSYMTESQTSMLDKVSADLNFVKDQLSASEQARLVGQEEINRLQDLAAMRDQEIASLRAWGEQVIVDMQALQAHAASLEAQLAAAQEAAATAVPAAAVAAAPPAAAPVAVEVGPLGYEVEGDPDGAYDEDEVDEQDVEDFDDVPLVEVDSLDGFADEPYADTPPEAPAPVAVSVPTVPVDVPAPAIPVVVPVDLSPVEAAPMVSVPVAFPDPVVAVPEPQEYETAVVPVTEAAHEAVYAPEVYPADAYVAEGYVPEVHTPEVYAPEVATAEAHVPAAPLSGPEEVPAVETAYEPAPEVAPAVEEQVTYDPEAPAGAVAPQPVVEDDFDDDVEADEVDWNIDSELPEGVALPGTGEAAYSYPAAAPGAPLETHGIPVGVWAPELDPRITQALAQEASQQAAPPAS